ncbi:hypothetical protein [Proteus mirabilis]|uniref:hypothetical protein n=1 Tax=Proteus mirabilis TaxID=584 RepID=UPI0034D75BB5
MGILNSQIKEKTEKDAKTKMPYSVTNTAFVPTGIDAIDYSFGDFQVNKKGEKIVNIGLGMGCIILMVGNSQGGKTTLGIQIADGMNQSLGGKGDIIDLDYENGLMSPKNRVMNITGMTEEEYEENFTHVRKELMSIEDLKDWVLRIVDMKKNLKKADMVEWKTLDGEPCLIYPPTFILVDSIPMLRSRELLEKEDMDSNMQAAQIAKVSNEVIAFINDKLQMYNITIIAMNHITTKVVTNAYAPKKIQFPGLA